MKYGFGIVDKLDRPWWGENCVSQDAGSLEEILVSLNDEEFGESGQPYRVVELVFDASVGKVCG